MEYYITYKLAKEFLCFADYFLHFAKLLILLSRVLSLIIASGSFLLLYSVARARKYFTLGMSFFLAFAAFIFVSLFLVFAANFF